MAWQLRLGYAILITLIWLSTATAITFVFEDVDSNNPPADPPDVEAGDLPIDAVDEERRARVISESIDLNDELMQVSGRIESATDVDLYRVQISLPDQFSATTLFVPGVTIENSQLFLFDAEGKGVCASDGNPSVPADDPLVPYAAIPQGTCQVTAGEFYYIGISTSVRDPIDANGNEIFPDPPPAERQMVLLPISDDIVVNWQDQSDVGNYVFQLTGVNYPLPECLGQTPPDSRPAVSLDVQDDELGIASITVTRSNNVDADGITFSLTPGTTEPVTVDVTQSNVFMSADVVVEVTNTRGLSTTCALNIDPDPDPTPPGCVDVFSLQGIPAVETTAQDLESGLGTLELLFRKNATVTVDGAPLPTIDGDKIIPLNQTLEPVLIRAEKIDLNERATVLIEVCDAGEPIPNCIVCDPLLFNLEIPEGQFSVQQAYNDIPEFDHFITIQNGNGIPGSSLMEVSVQVNNAPAHIFKLGGNEVVQLDVVEEMIPGLNTMTFQGKGLPGTLASIAISNQQPQITPPASSGFIVRRRPSSDSPPNPEWGEGLRQ